MSQLAKATRAILLCPLLTQPINPPIKQVEAEFLRSRAVAELLAQGAGGGGGAVRLARCFASDLRPCDASPMDSKFALLLEDFAPADGWRQELLLSAEPGRGCTGPVAPAA